MPARATGTEPISELEEGGPARPIPRPSTPYTIPTTTAEAAVPNSKAIPRKPTPVTARPSTSGTREPRLVIMRPAGRAAAATKTAAGRVMSAADSGE